MLRGRWLSGERLMVWWHLTEGPGDQTHSPGVGGGSPSLDQVRGWPELVQRASRSCLEL